jgi:pyridoxal phosphate enzyme (YggS family)
MEILSLTWKGSSNLLSNILTNVERVREHVAAAAVRARRDPKAITIIAVSKTHTVEEIRACLATGLTHLGENKVQELTEKWPAVGSEATWHLIGSLQTNKVKLAQEMANLIHSLDRDSLAGELAKQAERRGAPCEVLVQVNVSGETSKHGITPAELPAFLQRISNRGWLQVRGLMTMAPEKADPEAARPHFRRLRELREHLLLQPLPNVSLEHLSMGMSGDFPVAVEEGATLVRVGTAIFGVRDYSEN